MRAGFFFWFLRYTAAMKRAYEYGWKSTVPCGRRDQITDVPGVRVGHCTLDQDSVHTGVTVIVPPSDVYQENCIAAVHVQNGFGKSVGLMQVEELGVMETPIVLTNTLNTWKIADALCEHVLEEEGRKGIAVKTLNPVVGECNDSQINDIACRACGRRELEEAFAHASEEFEEGAVGAGRGTICYGLKGGIGSASRIVRINGQDYVFGLLVQSNFGKTECLRFGERFIGKQIAEKLRQTSVEDRGSIMMVLATDMPLTARQLKRIVRRVPNGLARTGGYTGNGSGEVVIGFTTADRIPRTATAWNVPCFADALLDPVFLAVSEMCEEAVLNSMLNAEPMKKRNGAVVHSLTAFL